MKPSTISALVVLAVAGTSLLADAANGWDHKALNDERQASAIVGGFSSSEARHYHDGIVYARSTGIRVGTKTIMQVVEVGKRHQHASVNVAAHTPTEPRIEARPSASPGFGMALLWTTIIGLSIFILAWMQRPSSSLSVTPTTLPGLEPAPSELKLARECAIEPIPVPGLLPHKDEVFYLRTCGDVAAIAEHHHAAYVGGYAGVSVRVMRGISVHSGSSRGKRVDRTTLDVDDLGTLYISNQRVLFVGGRKTVDVPFTRLVSVEPFVDGLKINRSNAAPLVLQTGSQREAAILQRIMANDLEPPTRLQSPSSESLSPPAKPGSANDETRDGSTAADASA